MGNFYAYILCDEDMKLYKGSTNDYHRRLKEHQKKRGGRTTKRMNGPRLVFLNNFPTRKEATDFEKKIGKWGRKRKIGLILAHNFVHLAKLLALKVETILVYN